MNNLIAVKVAEKEIIEKASAWTRPPFDRETRQEVSGMIERGGETLMEAFHQDLAFGTGGLRGVMGPGSNRMNAYTVGRATQGFANHLRKTFGEGEHSVAIAYDCRHNSRYFAEVSADVFAANGFVVHLFEELRPTPLLSFAVRKLNCKGGVVVTASHNPPEYNGYKVYWEGGAQVTSPNDQGIMEAVKAMDGFGDVKRGGDPGRIRPVGREMDEAYYGVMLGKLLDKKAIAASAQIPVVFTSLHGTAITLMPEALRRAGFLNIHAVERQAIPDGDFPTVESPNPEEGAALSMAIEEALEIGAELVLGTDPDGDRVGIAVRNSDGEFELLNGNDTGALLVWYQLFQLKAKGSIPANGYIGKTIVTTELIREIAQGFGVPCYDTLTGFKHIARMIADKEPGEVFITGGEESYGYMIGDFVRDKDAIAAATIICEMAAWARTQQKNLLDVLCEIHERFSLYREALISVTKPGRQGSAEIAALMDGFRKSPPSRIGDFKVVTMRDVQRGQELDLDSGLSKALDLPSSNVIQFDLEDGSRVTARPSGTEPKIKFYFSVCNRERHLGYRERRAAAETKIEQLKVAFTGQLTG